MTTTDYNINSSAYRLDQRRPQPRCDRCNARPAARRILTNEGRRYASENVCTACQEAK
jgi:hypothetical protein